MQGDKGTLITDTDIRIHPECNIPFGLALAKERNQKVIFATTTLQMKKKLIRFPCLTLMGANGG